ncbi:MAG: sigma-70 family RNA polymerase sigma factor [Myxococcota bacterium]
MAADTETQARQAFEAGDYQAATTRLLEGYGPEVLGWLIQHAATRSDAEDAFARVAETCWTSLPDFRWDCSGRTWLYVLARSALARIRRRPQARREIPRAEITDLVASVRSQTKPWLRTDVKSEFRKLYESLDEDSQMLLSLRIDRDLPWEEIARILGEAGDVKKASARLRQRFQGIKARLRKQALANGLLETSDASRAPGLRRDDEER